MEVNWNISLINAHFFPCRYMLGAAGIPSIIMFIGFLFLPESPRWLVFHGKLEKAVKVLYKLRDVSKVKQEIKEIVKDHEDYTNTRLGKWVWFYLWVWLNGLSYI